MSRKKIELPAPARLKVTGARVVALRYTTTAGIPSVVVKDTDGEERSYSRSLVVIARSA